MTSDASAETDGVRAPEGIVVVPLSDIFPAIWTRSLMPLPGVVLLLRSKLNVPPPAVARCDRFNVPMLLIPAEAPGEMVALLPSVKVPPAIMPWPVNVPPLTREPDGSHTVHISGPFESEKKGHAAVEDLTRQITASLEKAVRERPDHWFWVHRRWKTRPPG